MLWVFWTKYYIRSALFFKKVLIVLRKHTKHANLKLGLQYPPLTKICTTGPITRIRIWCRYEAPWLSWLERSLVMQKFPGSKSAQSEKISCYDWLITCVVCLGKALYSYLPRWPEHIRELSFVENITILVPIGHALSQLQPSWSEMIVTIFLIP